MTFKNFIIMKHIIYLSPNAPELDMHGALHSLERSATTSPLETLEALRKRSDEEVLIFDSPEQFAEAFNNETISDQGYILIIRDLVTDHTDNTLKDLSEEIPVPAYIVPIYKGYPRKS